MNLFIKKNFCEYNYNIYYNKEFYNLTTQKKEGDLLSHPLSLNMSYLLIESLAIVHCVGCLHKGRDNHLSGVLSFLLVVSLGVCLGVE